MIILFFRLWAQSGWALGWLYQKVDQWAPSFKAAVKTTQLLGREHLECRLKDHIQRQIYFFGAYEPIESYLLKSLVQADDIVIDAGANIGFYSLLIAQGLQTGRVYSFEPVPKNFKILQHNISPSIKEKNIFLMNKGLWHQKETLQFSLESDMEDNLGTFTAGSVKEAMEQYQCEVTTLDDFCKDFQRLDLIKMDIEGAELSALMGGQKTIDRLKPQFLIEINVKASQRFGYEPNQIAEFLKKLGYQFYQVGDVAERSRWINDFSHIQQANVFALNEKRIHLFPKNWDSKKIKKYFIDLQH